MPATTVASAVATGAAAGARQPAFTARVAQLADEQTRDVRRRHGEGPNPVAPVPEPALGLWPAGRHAWTRVAHMPRGGWTGAARHRAAGVEATRQRTGLVKAGMIPPRTEQPRHRQRTPRGRTRCLRAARHAWRTRVERTVAWEDQGKRRRRRFEPRPPRHVGMTWLAYTVIHGRECCAA